MSSPISIENLAHEIRTIYKSDQLRADRLIEDYIEETLKESPLNEKISLLEELISKFEVTTPTEMASPKAYPELHLESEEFSRLFSLIFGERISTNDLSSSEVLEKLAHSLNTVFDTLNQIIGVINVTLLGKKPELETIRHIIGSHLENQDGSDSLQSYLDQIRKAFLVAHKAFQQASYSKVEDILRELNPDHLETGEGGWLKFGPLRKAELFEIYKEKFKKCKGWFESGRFMEELLREFEKSCQKLYNDDRR
jgi:hypothetical protein